MIGSAYRNVIHVPDVSERFVNIRDLVTKLWEDVLELGQDYTSVVAALQNKDDDQLIAKLSKLDKCLNDSTSNLIIQDKKFLRLVIASEHHLCKEIDRLKEEIKEAEGEERQKIQDRINNLKESLKKLEALIRELIKKSQAYGLNLGDIHRDIKRQHKNVRHIKEHYEKVA